jgi:hypothetical protein
MASLDYMQGRKQYGRPQAILWANNPGTIVTGPNNTEGLNDPNLAVEGNYYVPLGYEVNSAGYVPGGDEFIILTDDNRKDIGITPERIETRQRTVNGRMRSYHVADKLKISISWDMIPSRAFSTVPLFNASTGNESTSTTIVKHTSDGGAAGAEMSDWYDRYTGSFWVYLAYDKYTSFGKDAEAYQNLPKYNQIVEVYFSSFNHSVIKRGPDFDFWNVSVELEEV